MRWMERKFSEEEVFEVIKNFGSSLGPDGFLMEFYRSYWHIIKTEFMKVMEELYR